MSHEGLSRQLSGLPSGVQRQLMSLVDAVIGLDHEEKERLQGSLAVFRQAAEDRIEEGDHRRQVVRILRSLELLAWQADRSAEGLPDTADLLAGLAADQASEVEGETR
jgi:hypothetical protein